jgi:hypothetical protein
MVVQRVREYFAERLDDVVHMVRDDRQLMRGWQEPPHLRAVVRRTVTAEYAGMTETTTTAVRVMAPDFSRAAAEPDRGEQREATGMLLEAGASGLEKVLRNTINEISPDETFALETVLLLYGRPALLVSEGRLASVPAFWNLLEDQREEIELMQRGVGRIEMLGHPEYDWAGTGFLVSENVLLTTRRIAETFVENKNGNWQFRPGISTWMDYRSEYQGVSNAGFRVRNVIGVHDVYDVALLEVEPPQINGSAPAPLPIAAEPPRNLEGRPVYLIGYPIREARRNEPETIARIFRDVYNVKRVQPGVLRGSFRFAEIQLLRHDCAPLGQTTGSPLVDLETQQVVGVQLTSRYLDTATAIPLYGFRNDPLFQRAGVLFTNVNDEEVTRVSEQLERLSRSRYWMEVRDMIDRMYQRAFGGRSDTSR